MTTIIEHDDQTRLRRKIKRARAPVPLQQTRYRKLLSAGDVQIEDYTYPRRRTDDPLIAEASEWVDASGYIKKYPQPLLKCFAAPALRVKQNNENKCADCPIAAECATAINARLQFAGRRQYERLMNGIGTEEDWNNLVGVSGFYFWMMDDKRTFGIAREAHRAERAVMRRQAELERFNELSRARVAAAQLQRERKRRELASAYDEVSIDFENDGVFTDLRNKRRSLMMQAKWRKRLADIGKLEATAIAEEACFRMYPDGHARSHREIVRVLANKLNEPDTDAFSKRVKRYSETLVELRRAGILHDVVG